MIAVTESGAATIAASLEARVVALDDLPARLERASDVIYLATGHRFDTEADGEWPPLAESTVAKKESQGYGEPAQALYAEGNLYESATSPYGPYSDRQLIRTADSTAIVMLVDWENDGWQIPVVLSEGTDNAGASHNVVIPARPIWPPADQMREQVRAVLFKGL